jgi:thiol-disulfide isomerase/thioredoxin
MEFLKQAEDYVKSLEEKIAKLEKENAAKDTEIRRLSVVGGKAPLASDAAASAAPAVAPSASAAAATPAPDAPKKGPLEGFTRIKIPAYREPTAQEKESLTVYENDPALGQKAPLMSRVKWFNGEAVEFGQGKPVVITFFSKLNKGDFGTLSLLSEIAQEFVGKVQFAGVSRDGEAEDVAKFAGKYHGKYFDELQSPDGKPGLTVYMTFPLGFDESGGFNTQLKQVMKKGTIGVGMTVLVDGEGTIRWYEQFVRGVNPMGQLATQIRNVLEGKPLVSNGPAPEVQVKEEAVDLPDDVDPFAKTGKY